MPRRRPARQPLPRSFACATAVTVTRRPPSRTRLVVGRTRGSVPLTTEPVSTTVQTRRLVQRPGSGSSRPGAQGNTTSRESKRYGAVSGGTRRGRMTANQTGSTANQYRRTRSALRTRRRGVRKHDEERGHEAERHRREGTDRPTSLRSDERSTSPKSAGWG